MSDLLWYLFLVVTTVLPVYSFLRGLARVRGMLSQVRLPKMTTIVKGE